ncbi:GNAT family N-acetyltransferase [Bacillus cereus]
MEEMDVPYFPFSMQEYSSYKEKMQTRLQEEPLSNLIIENNGQIIGTVGFYWSINRRVGWRWELLFMTQHTGMVATGQKLLMLYRDLLFEKMEIGRVGLTTWSGNERMMKVAEKIGMSLEGRMRKCRYYNGNIL